MEFWNHETQFEIYKRDGKIKDETWREFYPHYTSGIIQMDRHLYQNQNIPMYHAACEESWYSSERPYFKVWPSIIQQLMRVNLDIRPQDLNLPDSTILIRFAKNQEPEQGGRKLLAVLGMFGTKILEFQQDWYFMIFSAHFLENSHSSWKHPRMHLYTPLRFIENRTVGEALEAFTGHGKSLDNVAYPEPEDAKEYAKMAARAFLFTLLLANDPSIIKPDVLAADRNEFDRTTDPAKRQVMIDRARRKGIVGWRVGEEYETIPHFRRPHFALRHTGKGGTVPRIVPIKGSVVHRQKLTEVPTGYLDEEGNEVEP